MVEELRRSMQRRLAGFALRQICDAQDFLGTVCYTDARGFIPEEIKRTVVRVNTAVEPWVLLLSRIVDHRRLSQVATGLTHTRTQEVEHDTTQGAFVYARRWMRDEVGRTAKRNFMARRYMDDILLFYAENQAGTVQKWLRISKNPSATTAR